MLSIKDILQKLADGYKLEEGYTRFVLSKKMADGTYDNHFFKKWELKKLVDSGKIVRIMDESTGSFTPGWKLK